MGKLPANNMYDQILYNAMDSITLQLTDKR